MAGAGPEDSRVPPAPAPVSGPARRRGRRGRRGRSGRRGRRRRGRRRRRTVAVLVVMVARLACSGSGTTEAVLTWMVVAGWAGAGVCEASRRDQGGGLGDVELADRDAGDRVVDRVGAVLEPLLDLIDARQRAEPLLVDLLEQDDRAADQRRGEARAVDRGGPVVAGGCAACLSPGAAITVAERAADRTSRAAGRRAGGGPRGRSPSR